jgi:hypothetical protein
MVPNIVRQTTVYNYIFLSKTQLYSNSFLPSSIENRSNIQVKLRNAQSLAIFKKRLNDDVQKVHAHYYVGERRYQIIHTRLRTHCSSLKEHLFSKTKMIESPFCICGEIENTEDYFLHCPMYQDVRTVLSNNLSQITTVTLNTLLYGDNSLTDALNETIVSHIHKYIQSKDLIHNDIRLKMEGP